MMGRAMMDTSSLLNLVPFLTLLGLVLIGARSLRQSPAPIDGGCRNCSVMLDDALDHCPRCGTPILIAHR